MNNTAKKHFTTHRKKAMTVAVVGLFCFCFFNGTLPCCSKMFKNLRLPLPVLLKQQTGGGGGGKVSAANQSGNFCIEGIIPNSPVDLYRIYHLPVCVSVYFHLPVYACVRACACVCVCVFKRH